MSQIKQAQWREKEGPAVLEYPCLSQSASLKTLAEMRAEIKRELQPQLGGAHFRIDNVLIGFILLIKLN